MWNNLFGSAGSVVAEKAKRQITATLENAGDVITDLATSHVAKQREKEKLAAAAAEQQHQQENSTEENQHQQAKNLPAEDLRATENKNNPFASIVSPFVDVVGKQFLESTKHVIENAGKSLQHLRDNMSNSNSSSTTYYIRDPSLPLDTEALKDAEVVYITDRIITMGHPAMQSTTDGDITPQRKLAAVGHLLQKRHAGKYMVWNLSEVEYDYSVLQDQVLTHCFPGSPSPPLGLLLKLILSMESWLKADKENVAVIHCLTGKGRTSTVLACFLCWTGEAGFTRDPMAALEYIALCKRYDSVDKLTIPSQRRYIGYFSNMLDGVRPHQPPLSLKRIIMSEAPKYERDPSFSSPWRNSPSRSSNISEASAGAEESKEKLKQQGNSSQKMTLGCSPYIQIFKAGKLILTAASAAKYSQDKEDLPFCLPSDGSITFPIEQVLQGDVLVRCRHLATNGKRVSMFRAAFHTGYTPPKVMRLTKAQLDGACTDSRFSDDFFIDLVFEACDADTASKHLLSLTAATTNSTAGEMEKIVSNETKGNKSEAAAPLASCNEAELRRSRATVQITSSAAISASTYDTMLHRDSRFWDVIAEKRSSRRQSIDTGSFSRYGPTIGRRRNSATLKTHKKNNDGSTKLFDYSDKNQESVLSDNLAEDEPLELIERRKKLQKAHSIRRTMDTFTIGGGDVDVPSNPSRSTSEPSHKKKDELMEALMALEDDMLRSHDEEDEENVLFYKETESEIDFESFDNAESNEAFSNVDQSIKNQHDTDELGLPGSNNGTVENSSSANENTAVEDIMQNEKSVTDDYSSEDLSRPVAIYPAAEPDDYLKEIDAMVEETAAEDVVNFDENDDDLEDLEKFLTQSGK